MDEQNTFFSDKHNQLLNIAYTAKNVARIVLVVYVLYGIGTYYMEQTNQLAYNGLPNYSLFFMDMLAKNPMYALGLVVQIISILIRGIIYFLILKAISLGLNMIVETDINYRDARKEGVAQ